MRVTPPPPTLSNFTPSSTSLWQFSGSVHDACLWCIFIPKISYQWLCYSNIHYNLSFVEIQTDHRIVNKWSNMQFLARLFVSNPSDVCAETSFIDRIISFWLRTQINCKMYFLDYMLVTFKNELYHERLYIKF